MDDSRILTTTTVLHLLTLLFSSSLLCSMRKTQSDYLYLAAASSQVRYSQVQRRRREGNFPSEKPLSKLTGKEENLLNDRAREKKRDRTTWNHKCTMEWTLLVNLQYTTTYIGSTTLHYYVYTIKRSVMRDSKQSWQTLFSIPGDDSFLLRYQSVPNSNDKCGKRLLAVACCRRRRCHRLELTFLPLGRGAPSRKRHSSLSLVDLLMNAKGRFFTSSCYI